MAGASQLGDTWGSGPHGSGQREVKDLVARPDGRSAVASRRLAASRSGSVERRRLIELVQLGVRGPLTLVSASAGFGKSVLVTSWEAAASPTDVVAHLTMRQEDQSPSIFWASAIETLRSAGLMEEVRPPGTRAGADEPLLRSLVRQIKAHRRPLVWILDCDAYVLPRSVGDGLATLLEKCQDVLRLVILTRADPPLPLHRYRLAGSITEIRAADLRFTVAEATALLQRAGVELAPVDTLAISSRTGGWPAGLKFAAIMLSGSADTDQAVREFRGDSANVAAYLMSEVYARQPAPIRDFLLRTCVVEELSPGLASALTGQDCDAGVMQFLSHGNSFIEAVPGKPGWYRVQSLFREFLSAQLTFEHPDLKADLRRAAAEWLAADGQVVPALTHAVAADAWSTATRILVDGLWFGNLLIGKHRDLYRSLFAQMPRDDSPGSVVVSAALALADRDHVRARRDLDAAQRMLGADMDIGSRSHALAVSVLEAVCAGLGPDPSRALDQATTAMAALRECAPEERRQHPDLEALLVRCLASALIEQGDFPAALELLDAGVSTTGSDMTGLREEVQGLTALAHAAQGRLRQAERALARTSPVDPGPDEVSGAALLALCWVRLEEYHLAEARALLKRAEEGALPYETRVLTMVLALLRARLLSADGASQWSCATLHASAGRQVEGPAQSWLERQFVMEETLVLLAAGSTARAVVAARSLDTEHHLDARLVARRAARASGRVPEAIVEPSRTALDHEPLTVQLDLLLDLADQHLEAGNKSRAAEAAARAVRTAEPARLRRPFFEASESVRGLLETTGVVTRARWLRTSAADRDRATPDPGSVGERERAPGGDSRSPADLVTPLSPKELEVLVHLAELLTTEEIAEAMYVSVNTVRTHVRNILRKFQVTRRNEAVRRAWQLGLLQPPSVS